MGSLGRPGAAVAAGRRLTINSPLFAAYCEGLGVAAVVVIRRPAGFDVSAAAQGCNQEHASSEPVEARWWCRRASEARRIAAAARTRARRRESNDANAVPDEHAPRPTAQTFAALDAACDCVLSAAMRLKVGLQTDCDLLAEADVVVARVDKEIERLQRSGELKSVNSSYRTYRMQASARGEKIIRYADWINKYKENMVRALAAALRYS